MEFEWDIEKARSNIRKHGLSYEDAALVFLDPFRVTALDERFDYEEDRFVTIGYIGERLCVVAFTEKQDAIRIISARKATRQERRRHDNG